MSHYFTFIVGKKKPAPKKLRNGLNDLFGKNEKPTKLNELAKQIVHQLNFI